MGWFSDLFKSGSQKPPFRNATIEPDKPWPRGEGDFIMLPKGAIYVPPKDISEPVISFVECVRNNPQRFRFKGLKILDKKTGTWFSSKYYYSDVYQTYDQLIVYRSLKNTNTEWMTKEEFIYAIEELTKIQEDKVKAYKKKQRQKYIEIYVESK